MQKRAKQKTDPDWEKSDSNRVKERGRDKGTDKGKERSKGQGKERVRTHRKELPLEEGMVRYRLEVGHIHEVKPGNIVGAIANEAGLDSQYIGRINIYDDYSVIDLPDGMPKDVFNDLKKVWVAGQQLRISNISKAPKSTKFSSCSKERKNRKDTNKGTLRSKVSRKKPVRRK